MASRRRGLIPITSEGEICYEKHAAATVNLGTVSEFASRCNKKQI
jgi:hypothetical protein